MAQQIVANDALKQCKGDAFMYRRLSSVRGPAEDSSSSRLVVTEQLFNRIIRRPSHRGQPTVHFRRKDSMKFVTYSIIGMLLLGPL